MERWKVEAAQSGQTLLSFIKGCLGPSISAKQIKRAVDGGSCLLNGRGERFASRLVGRGDVVEFSMPERQEKKPTGGTHSLRFLYADELVFALDKPAGMVSDGVRMKEAIGSIYPGSILLHRLDKDTTGVLLFARTPEAAEAIEKQFKQRQVAKTYYAIVDGVIKQKTGKIDNFLGKIGACHGQTLWGEVAGGKGLPAYTEWEVVKKGREATMVVCKPRTGRTHQLRVHLSGIDHPILGDSQYGKSFKCRYKPARCLLHAAEITFQHPSTGKLLTIESPFPEDFNEAAAALMGGK